jgi:hypothetical protein
VDEEAVWNFGCITPIYSSRHSSAVLTRLSLLYNYTSAPPRSRDFREDEYEVNREGRLNTYCMAVGTIYTNTPLLY